MKIVTFLYVAASCLITAWGIAVIVAVILGEGESTESENEAEKIRLHGTPSEPV